VADTTVQRLLEILEEKTAVPAPRLELLAGFPPRPLQLPSDHATATVAGLGLQNGDTITVRESAVPAAAPAALPVAAPTPAPIAAPEFSAEGIAVNGMVSETT
jgi:ubiquitin thioesterase OTU1